MTDTLIDRLRTALAAGPRCPLALAAEMGEPVMPTLDSASYDFERVAGPGHWWWRLTAHGRLRSDNANLATSR